MIALNECDYVNSKLVECLKRTQVEVFGEGESRIFQGIIDRRVISNVMEKCPRGDIAEYLKIIMIYSPESLMRIYQLVYFLITFSPQLKFVWFMSP